MTSATGSDHTTEFAYDDAGNLTAMTGSGAFTYGAGAAPTTAFAGVSPESFAYDDRGNVITAPWGEDLEALRRDGSGRRYRVRAA